MVTIIACSVHKKLLKKTNCIAPFMVKFTFVKVRGDNVKTPIIGLIFVIGVLGVFLYPNGSIAKETSLDKVDFKQMNVESHKKWTLQFTDGIVENKLTKDNVYVTDEKKQLIPVSLNKIDSKTVEVNAPKQGYDKQHVYTLFINKKLDKTNNLYKNNVKSEEYSIQFTVK